VRLLPTETLAELERLRLVVRRLPGRQGGEGAGGRAGGFGLDFHEYTPYSPGDDVRRVDWRRWQRSGDLLIRSDLDRSGHAVRLVVDRSGSMALGTPSKLDYACRLAAAVAFAALQAGHPVGVAAFAGADGAVLPARAGIHWLATILGFLEGLQAGGPTDLQAGLHAAVSGRLGEGRIVFISDLLDPSGAEAGLDLLAGPRRAVDVVEVTAQDEGELPAGATIDALDAETGRVRTFTVTAEVADAWRQGFEKTRADVRTGCAQRGLNHLQVRSDDSPVQAVRALSSSH
jgi:uncharacterized protein (DUF58 family)